MILFASEEHLESSEESPESAGDALLALALSKGEKKTEEPHHRNKKLRAWPSEASRKEIYLECLAQETGSLPERGTLEAWKLARANKLWESLTQNISEEDRAQVLHEHAMSHIAKVVANTIHLETMYRSLKPIGQKQWDMSPKELRKFVDDDALLALTENPELFRQNGKRTPIPDWIKGAILYLAIQGGRAGRNMLNPHTKNLTDLAALKTAANWCLGNHLVVKGKPKSIEETHQIFEGWKKRRSVISLEIVRMSVEEIPQEVQVPCPKDTEGKDLPWNLTWNILPITEKEIRELGESVLENPAYRASLGGNYKKHILDRWITNAARRAYIRKFETTQGVAERWRTKTLILNPLNDWVDSRIAGKTNLRLTAKTEAAWKMLTEDLPEPEIA